MAYGKLLLAGCAGGLILSGSAFAQDGRKPDKGGQLEDGRKLQEGLQLDVSAGVSFEGNPYFERGSHTSAASGFVQLDPRYRMSDEVSSVVVDGSLKVDQYFGRYDTAVSGRLGLDVSRRLSPATTLRGHLGARTSRTSALDFFLNPGAPVPNTPPAIVIPDVSFAGTRFRTTQVEAAVGVDHTISERDEISVDLASSLTRFSGLGQSDYRYATATSEYRRALSARTSGFLSLRLGATDYLDRSADDGIIVTPTAGIVTQLSPTLSLEAGLGASLSRVKLPGGGHSSHISPAGRVKLCDRASTGQSCLYVNREAQPTALSGVSTVTNLGASVTRRLNEKDELSAFASYTLNGSRSGLGSSLAADLFTAGATYSHDFNRRFAGFVSPSYSRLYDGVPRHSNPALRLGLRYRFGGAG